MADGWLNMWRLKSFCPSYSSIWTCSVYGKKKRTIASDTFLHKIEILEHNGQLISAQIHHFLITNHQRLAREGRVHFRDKPWPHLGTTRLSVMHVKHVLMLWTRQFGPAFWPLFRCSMAASKAVHHPALIWTTWVGALAGLGEVGAVVAWRLTLPPNPHPPNSTSPSLDSALTSTVAYIVPAACQRGSSVAGRSGVRQDDLLHCGGNRSLPCSCCSPRPISPPASNIHENHMLFWKLLPWLRTPLSILRQAAIPTYSMRLAIPSLSRHNSHAIFQW